MPTVIEPIERTIPKMNERRSRQFPLRNDRQPPSYYQHMLSDDTYGQAAPYRSGPDAYVLTAEGAQAHTIRRALSLSHHKSDVDDFVRHVASRLLSQPEVWLEVWFANGTGSEKMFGVCEVQGVTRRHDGRLVQALPAASDLPDWVTDDGKWGSDVELDDTRMIRVLPPATYPTAVLRGVVRDLAEIRVPVMPNWALAQIDGSRRDAPVFDVAEANRTERLAVAQITRPIGWSAREWIFDGGTSRTMSEYYRRWRDLHFLHFLASLREQAEDALRKVLALAGDRCGFVASVVTNDICTPDEVSEIIRQFENGDLTVKAVDDIMLQRPGAAGVGQRQVV